MTRRYVSQARAGMHGLAALIAVALVACYDPPQPECGFRCGPDGACPQSYTCGDDGRCRLDGTSPSAPCNADTPDAASSPTVIERTPPPGATEVDVSTQVHARFDVDVENVSPATFVAFANGEQLPGGVAYASTTRRATFEPEVPLPPRATITVGLASQITARDTGRALEQTAWSFTTGLDNTPPAVVTTTPANAATGVSVTADIVVSFSEPVMNVDAASFAASGPGGMIDGTFAMSDLDRLVTFDPTAPMPPASTITVTLSSAITDRSGNPLASQTFSFSTGP